MIATMKPVQGQSLPSPWAPFFSRPRWRAEDNGQTHDLLVWAGDRAGKGNDFLIVINADPASP